MIPLSGVLLLLLTGAVAADDSLSVTDEPDFSASLADPYDSVNTVDANSSGYSYTYPSGYSNFYLGSSGKNAASTEQSSRNTYSSPSYQTYKKSNYQKYQPDHEEQSYPEPKYQALAPSKPRYQSSQSGYQPERNVEDKSSGAGYKIVESDNYYPSDQTYSANKDQESYPVYQPPPVEEKYPVYQPPSPPPQEEYEPEPTEEPVREYRRPKKPVKSEGDTYYYYPVTAYPTEEKEKEEPPPPSYYQREKKKAEPAEKKKDSPLYPFILPIAILAFIVPLWIIASASFSSSSLTTTGRSLITSLAGLGGLDLRPFVGVGGGRTARAADKNLDEAFGSFSELESEVDTRLKAYMSALQSDDCMERILCELGVRASRIPHKNIFFGLMERLGNFSYGPLTKDRLDVLRTAAMDDTFNMQKCQTYTCKTPALVGDGASNSGDHVEVGSASTNNLNKDSSHDASR